MKNVVFCILIMTFCGHLSGQDSIPVEIKPDRSYLIKAANQKGVAQLLVVTGTLLVVTGAVISASDFANAITFQSGGNGSLGGVLFLTGLAMEGLSIVLFAQSKKNKKRAYMPTAVLRPGLQLSGGSSGPLVAYAPGATFSFTF